MGSGASVGEMPGADLHLPTSGLHFTAQQVRSLNSYVDTLYDEDQNGRMSMETECGVESLVQRIVDGAGQRDPRFRCCHLIALHRGKKMRSRSLEYLVTLDSLPLLNDSEECILHEGPVGYGKIRLSGREADKWAEFLTPSGYLCRDRLVERWVELIARCAQSRGGGASRALSASAAAHARPYTYCYLERASHSSSVERRLAIVEGAAWVLVRVGAGEAEAKLVLAARAAGCSAYTRAASVPIQADHLVDKRASHSSSVERRLAIVEGAAWVVVRVGAGEAEAKPVLAARAAGCSACARATSGPRQADHLVDKRQYDTRSSHSSSVERRLAIVEGAAWVLVRVGAGEAEAKLVLAARAAGCSACARATSVPLTHPLALLHYTAAQANYYATAVGPPSSVSSAERGLTWQLWHPSFEATLDAHCSQLSPVAKLAGALNCLVDKMREGCFQGSAQLLSRYAVRCALWRRLEQCAVYRTASARACVSAHASHHLLLVLDNLLQVCERGGVAGYVFPTQRGGITRRGARDADWRADIAAVANCLMYLQRIAVGDHLSPSPAECVEAAVFARGETLVRACTGAACYTRPQLRYLSRVTRELLTLKNMITHEPQSTFRANLLQATCSQESGERLVLVLAVALDQARQLRLRPARSGDDLAEYRSKKWNKLREYYDASSACLIDAVRRDELRGGEPADETALMRSILQWLYRGAKEDKKYLGPVLRPYLDDLYTTSLENAWLLEDFEAKKCTAEFEGLKEFCLRVHDKGLEPCVGLLDAAKKYAWAKALVDVVDRYRHVDFRLVFPTGDGLAVSYQLKLPSRREHSSARLLTLSRRDKAEAKLRLARRCVLGAFHAAMVGKRPASKHISRHESTEEILASVKNGNFWRNSTKPDVIPSNNQDANTLERPKVRRRSRRSRPATSHGFPEISITNQSDTKTLRRKYHTLKSLVYTEPVESIRELKERPRSAGSTVRNKDSLSRPSILETLDFINGVKEALCVEESGISDVEDMVWSAEDEWVVAHASPLNLIASRCGNNLHLTLGDVITAMLLRGKFTILQELCYWLGESSEGALFALHRLARAARARSSERANNTWKLPEAEGSIQEPPERYRVKTSEASEDEAPQPPPLPRRVSRDKLPKRYSDFVPSPRVQPTQPTTYSQPHLPTHNFPSRSCTGIINPIYDIKMPKDKFSVKRTKSLGRSFSSRSIGLDITRYNLTLGHRNGKRTNDVVTAINGTSTETGLDCKSNAFQRYSSSNVVGDSYRISRITIE